MVYFSLLPYFSRSYLEWRNFQVARASLRLGPVRMERHTSVSCPGGDVVTHTQPTREGSWITNRVGLLDIST